MAVFSSWDVFGELQIYTPAVKVKSVAMTVFKLNHHTAVLESHRGKKGWLVMLSFAT